MNDSLAWALSSARTQTLAMVADLLDEDLCRQSTSARRVAAARRMTDDGLDRPTPDPQLLRTQPTLAHHLQALVFHEGYHAGQLSSWRRAQ